MLNVVLPSGAEIVVARSEREIIEDILLDMGFSSRDVADAEISEIDEETV